MTWRLWRLWADLRVWLRDVCDARSALSHEGLMAIRRDRRSWEGE